MTENLPAATVQADVVSTFGTSSGFALLQRQAQMLANSFMVPEAFSIFNKDRKLKNADEQRYAVANAVIAIEMAMRIGASPLMVAQNLVPIHGRPTWSSQFVIACINASGKFSPLRFDVSGDGDARQCLAWAFDLATRDRLEGPPVSIAMAKKEGWYQKNGSKWQTMPELMLRYRSAAFFGRLYAPDLLMGMRSADEAYDVGDDIIEVKTEPAESKIADINAEIKQARKAQPKKAPESPTVNDLQQTKANTQAEPHTAATCEPQQQAKEKPVANQSTEIPTTAETAQADVPSSQAVPPEAKPSESEKPAAGTDDDLENTAPKPDAVAAFMAEIDAIPAWTEIYKWESANHSRLTQALPNADDRGQVLTYANCILHCRQIDEYQDPDQINEWAEMKIPGLMKQFEMKHPPSAKALFERVQKYAGDKIQSLRKASAPTDGQSTEAEPVRSKDYQKFREQLYAFDSRVAVQKWMISTQMKRERLEDDEEKLLQEEIMHRVLELEAIEAEQKR